MDSIIDYIEQLYREKTMNVDPGSATDLACSLDLLSSGIYTEDERFIFELLQNAVDSHEQTSTKLNIKIVAEGGFLVFMHNGKPFDRRDIEGLCSVGHGAKATDSKKIGYKGIGFKSVFMHSDDVTIHTSGCNFCFNKKHWDNFFKKSISASGRRYKMPWQIIPIPAESVPCPVSPKGFNVCTYIKTERVAELSKKISALLADSQFLLFLGNYDIEIQFHRADGSVISAAKSTSQVTRISASQAQCVTTLLTNGKPCSQWLVYSNSDVALTSTQRCEISHDSKTPQKLQTANSFDMAFAMRLDESGNIVSEKDARLYTYLPTSFSFGLDFLVNANFITDAGRQQLSIDSTWNHAVIAKIPELYLRWIATLSTTHPDFHKVLPLKRSIGDSLSPIFNEALDEAVHKVAFLPSLNNARLLKADEAVIDTYGLINALPADVAKRFIFEKYSISDVSGSLVAPVKSKALSDYGVKSIGKKEIAALLEDAPKWLTELSVSDDMTFVVWLHDCTLFAEEEGSKLLSQSAFLLDEDGKLTKPSELFFPSNFKDKESMASDAKVISKPLFDQLEQKGLHLWLEKLGVQEMSSLSVIKNVLLAGSYITKDNAVQIAQFIFDANKKENVLKELDSWRKRCLRVLTKKGTLMPTDNLYLTENYLSGISVGANCETDAFVSSEYIRQRDEPLEWAAFFREFGVKSEIKLDKVTYDRGSTPFKKLQKYADYAQHHEYNHSSWTGGNYYMYPSSVVAKFNTLLSFDVTDFSLKQIVWSILLAKAAEMTHDDDYIYGSTGGGYMKSAYLCDDVDGHRYLGENFLPWAVKNFPLLPGTDGNLHKVGELLENTETNREICGKEIPVLDVTCTMHPSWRKYLSFKKELSLNDCLKALSYLQKSKEESDVGDRISFIYDYVSTHFSTNDYQDELCNWGKLNRIRLIDGSFDYPKDVVLVSDDLGRLDLPRQVFRGKHIGKRNERFVRFMKSIGVKFIDSFTPKYEESEIDTDFKSVFMAKAEYLTLLSLGSECSESDYKANVDGMRKKMETLSFFRDKSIFLCYGDQRIQKKAYADGLFFHYVGKLNLGTLEILHTAIAKALGITGTRTELLPVIQQSSEENREYLESKGYPVGVLPTLPATTSDDAVTLGGRPDDILCADEREDYNREAREIVKQHLEPQGYKFTNGIGQLSVVHGVVKDGVTYPLVVKSHRTSHPIKFNPDEWNTLSESHSMLWVHFGNRIVKAVNIKELLRRQDNLTFSFATTNLINDERVEALVNYLHYFKQMHIDIDSLSAETVAEKYGNYEFNRSTNKEIELTCADSDSNL